MQDLVRSGAQWSDTEWRVNAVLDLSAGQERQAGEQSTSGAFHLREQALYLRGHIIPGRVCGATDHCHSSIISTGNRSDSEFLRPGPLLSQWSKLVPTLGMWHVCRLPMSAEVEYNQYGVKCGIIVHWRVCFRVFSLCACVVSGHGVISFLT